jgi:hypothetical protein
LLKEKLNDIQTNRFQEELVERGGVNIPVSILFIESRAKNCS